MPTDLEFAFAALAGKQARYNLLWDYYSGLHPLVYNASKLREIFRNIDASFNENWSAVVVNTVLDRIGIERFQVGDGRDATTADTLMELWRNTGLELDAYDAHLCTLVTGEAFVVCGQDEAGAVEAYYNDSRLCHMFYLETNPHLPSYAAKWWEEAAPDGRGTVTRLTLYYPDRFEYYQAPRPRQEMTSGKGFAPAEVPSAPNPYGEIPVYHLRREQRAIISEMADIIAPQAQLNKMLADMMIAAEFGAYKQRYVISQMAASDIKLKNAPNEIWPLPAGDGEGQGTSVGEFSATELSNYLGAIERTAGVIATVASIPKILLFAQGDIPSGASLRALEAPLVRKAERYSARWETTWRKVLRWLLRVAENQDVPANEIDVVWAIPHTTQPETDALIIKTLVEAGVPLRTALRSQGWNDAQLDQMEQDQADEQTAGADLATTLLAAAEANANRQAAVQPVQNGNGVTVDA
jgi:hypothetical protein